MITSGVIITCIVCFTILCISLIIGHYSNKDIYNQKIKDSRSLIYEFRRNYITFNAKNDKREFNGKSIDIINLTDNIYDILN